MAERYGGRVVRVSMAGNPCPVSQRMLELALDEAEGIMAYSIDADGGTLTAYLDDATCDEDAILRAMLAAGLYPTSSYDVGVTDQTPRHVC